MDQSVIENDTWLSERESELFILRYKDGKKVRECADEMEIEANTVKAMLGRIRNKREKSENTIELFEEVENN